jgi:cytochrome c oxidase cbb3-type subunit 2
MWGPASELEKIKAEQPPLIGNRRQGPDLSDVGTRRSAQWLRIHFLNPREISYKSPMPGYAYLFNDSRGDDLIAYLQTLSSPEAVAHLKTLESSWQPQSTENPADSAGGKTLFQHLCATCHDAGGNARFHSGFQKIPPDLTTTPWTHMQKNLSHEEMRIQLMRIIKFGVPQTDMAGHEYLDDAQISSLADYVLSSRRPNAIQNP